MKLHFWSTLCQPSPAFLFCFVFKLEDNRFTVLLASSVQQHESAIYPFPRESPSHPSRSSQSTSWAPSYQQLPTSSLFYIWWCTDIRAALTIGLTLLCPQVSICVSIPALQIGSSVPFFQSPYIYINRHYLFFWLYPHRCKWLSSIPFRGWVIVHHIYVPLLAYPFICLWTLGCFPSLQLCWGFNNLIQWLCVLAQVGDILAQGEVKVFTRDSSPNADPA